MTFSNPDPKRYQVIGTSPARPDAVDKVTGRALYGADIRLPGMLYGAVLRSPHAHARIIAIDTRAVRKLAGVQAVITAADLPGQDENAAWEGYNRDNILARDKVLYEGHPILAVAADTLTLAQAALELVRVEYEVLPPVMDVRQAMQAGAPVLLPGFYLDASGNQSDRPGNIALHNQIKVGEVEKGFAEAEIIVEREFNTATVHQGYIEPQNGTALWSRDGEITIWCSTQGAFGVRDQVADLLQIPVETIRVIPLEIGGGFGGKNNVYLEPLAALLSREAGNRPVQMEMTRAEVLLATGPAPGSYIRAKIGAKASGQITAAQAYLAYEAGAYPGSPLWGGMGSIFSAYRIPNILIDGYDVLVNKPRSSTYRAPGTPNAIFAAETLVDELAEKLNLEPLEFRRLNAVKEGDSYPEGAAYQRIGFLETLEAAGETPHFRTPLTGPHRGRGIASSYWGGGGGQSSVAASLDPDGSIRLVMGSVDLAGARLVIAMQLAETLGLRVESIHASVGDTASVGYTEGSYGSRTTVATGIAAHELGEKLITEWVERAAAFWGVETGRVHYDRGQLACESWLLTLADLAALPSPSGPQRVSVSVDARVWAPGFAVHIVDVDVEPETGKVEILRYTAVQDVGSAIHPDLLQGQIQGGVTQGIGWALNEAYIYDEQGHLLNANLADYRMPACLDIPAIETVLVQVPSPDHPYGARGAGEIPIVPPPAAIANAIYRAVGVRLNVLPMTPPRILDALLASQTEPNPFP